MTGFIALIINISYQLPDTRAEYSLYCLSSMNYFITWNDRKAVSPPTKGMVDIQKQ